ncbi:hypothetical protein EVAR_76870_1 [Eumeta japonica]|uniref:Reverse transcriptase domain-containing protein n=1 Tax=Eumeta variegata TaxID=151549 RepID=A0A4C1SEN3_EUMVA|nr:hypothetical protein EVAR_76870_1 [Eumeta japonica]
MGVMILPWLGRRRLTIVIVLEPVLTEPVMCDPRLERSALGGDAIESNVLEGSNGYLGNIETVMGSRGCTQKVLREYVRTEKLSVKCLLYADDQIILAPSSCELLEMVMVFAKARLNAMYTWKVRESNKRKRLYAWVVCLQMVVNMTDIERRVNVRNKANGALLAIMNSKSASRQARLAILNGVLIPMLTYGSEMWVWQKKNKSGSKCGQYVISA